jgi:hypothetical protein
MLPNNEYLFMMEASGAPVAVLEIARKNKNGFVSESREPVYGGYANARGQVSLFAERCAYSVNFKSQTLRERPSLNSGAQVHYEAAEAGEPFVYANVTFLRLSHERIAEICASGTFRVRAS